MNVAVQRRGIVSPDNVGICTTVLGPGPSAGFARFARFARFVTERPAVDAVAMAEAEEEEGEEEDEEEEDVEKGCSLVTVGFFRPVVAEEEGEEVDTPFPPRVRSSWEASGPLPPPPPPPPPLPPLPPLEPVPLLLPPLLPLPLPPLLLPLPRPPG
jgi:hypothetical protein